MRFMFNLRNFLFWQLDALRGGIVLKHKRDIDGIGLWSKMRRQEDQEEKLKRILSHARRTVPFYQSKGGSELISFPVVSKHSIKVQFDQHISQLYSTKDLKKVTTSGSTGVPFQVYHDRRKTSRNTADTISFAERAKFKLGIPLIYLKIWNEHNHKSKLAQFLENVVPINVIDLSNSSIELILKELNEKFSEIAILGYASAIEEISKVVINKNLDLRFKVLSVITMSEGLDEKSRETIKKALRTNNVFARYSNVENGIIAQQVDDSPKYLINTSSYFIEILDDKNEAVGLNRTGRIVVTDLFNYAMPMIRYDTGDLGMLHKEKVGDIEMLYLGQVGGRKMDSIYDVYGNLLSSFIITNGMWDYPELKQYQFVQHTSNEYEFILNCEGVFEKEEALISQYIKILGTNARIHISYVDEIPLLSSGKRRKVINKMN